MWQNNRKNSKTQFIKAQFSENVAENTEAFAIVISDKSHFPEWWEEDEGWILS